MKGFERRRVRFFGLLMGVGLWFTFYASAQPSASPVAYRWFSIPLEVTQVPADAAFIPISATLDFNLVLSNLHETGLVDTRSLRLYRTLDNGEEEQPFQFTPLPQSPSGQRQLLPGTSSQVSYMGEYLPAQTWPGLRNSGQLTWILRSSSTSSFRYRLKFGVPQQGRMIQVPYPPYDLHLFDEGAKAVAPPWFARMQIRPQQLLEGKMQILEDQQSWTTYFAGPSLSNLESADPLYRRPFFYPVNGPDGIGLTGFGKPHDPTESHAHHYSFWIAHASVDGVDFWSERGGIIAHEQLAELEDGPIYCRFVQKLRWQSKEKTLLAERRQCTFYASDATGRFMDIELDFTPADEPVVLGKTTFGFLAVRVAQSLSPFDGGGEILNASGDRNEQGAHLKRASWIDQSGPIAQDKWGGIAILDHPGNPGFPIAWHCRNDGWAGASFNKDGPFTLASGEHLRLRYRLFLHRYNAKRSQVGQRFAEWTAQPRAEWGQPAKLP